MTNPASGTISLSQINNAGTTTNAMGSLVNEIIAGNSAAGQNVSMNKYYYTQAGAQQAVLTVTPNPTGSSLGLGTSCALSADGNTLAAGGPFGGATNGYIGVFTRSGTTWSQQAYLPIGNNIGYSSSLSADGNLLFSTGFQSAYIPYWKRTGTSWVYYGTIPPLSGVAGQNCWIASSADGRTIAVGSPFSGTSNSGAVYICYDTTGNQNWIIQGTFTDGTANDQLGTGVAISADGNTVAAVLYNGGTTYVYTRSGSTWSQQAAIGSTTGYSVALSADGNTLLTGSQGGTPTYVFRTGTTWGTPVAVTKPPNASSYAFGYSVALSADGNTAVIGDWGGGQYTTGAATIYTRSGSTFNISHANIAVASGYQYSGQSVACGDNGNVVSVGAQQYPNSNGGGAIYVFV